MQGIEAGDILDQTTPETTDPAGPSTDALAAAPKEESISPKLSILMERERQALNRERMAKTQEERLKERLKKIEDFESVKTDPKKALDMLGLSYDDLTQSILNDGQVSPKLEIQQLRDQIDQLKNQLSQEKSLEAEEKKKEVAEKESKAVTDFKGEIREHIKSQASRYELIDFEQAEDLVFEVIDEHYMRTMDQASGVGKIMSIQDASDKVEQFLEKKYLSAREKNKVKAFWSNMPKVQEALQKKPETSQPPKTLTNNLATRVQTKQTRPSEDQRVSQIVQEHLAKMRSQYA